MASAMIYELPPEDESFAMTNLSPRMTGLTRHVFVSPQLGSHDLRIKVSVTPGKNTVPDNCASIALRPTIRHVAGQTLPPSVMREVEHWATLNIKALEDYWDGITDTGELLAALKRI